MKEFGRLLKFVSGTPGTPSGVVKWSTSCPTYQKSSYDKGNKHKSLSGGANLLMVEIMLMKLNSNLHFFGIFRGLLTPDWLKDMFL